MNDPLEIERAEAWIGDAVLALAAREWILRQHDRTDGAMLARLTSNQFLSSWGNPTAVEARLGRLYRSEGLAAAMEFVEREMIPLFLKQERNRTGR
ncbi:MAG: hypothetical protein JNK37_03600 [Verrucomicrobiales bacterium]|nr:hypothetical protein [Verrucomicrobiales bacterium]